MARGGNCSYCEFAAYDIDRPVLLNEEEYGVGNVVWPPNTTEQGIREWRIMMHKVDPAQGAET